MANTPLLNLPYPTEDDTVDPPRDFQALASAIDPLGVVPIGAMMMWLVAAAPAGWLLAIGQQIDAAQYPGLAALFGQAGGLVTLPDMRDVFPVGAGATMPLGQVGGAANVSLTSAQSGMPAHGHANTLAVAQGGAHTHSPDDAPYHFVTAPATMQYFSVAGAASNQVVPYVNTPGDFHVRPATGQSPTHAHNLTGGVTNNNGVNAAAAHENRPPYLAINFIIRAG